MDAQVLIGGNDVTTYLLDIHRTYNYCEVAQTFTVELDISYPTTINTYDDVVIYEEGTKVLTGYVGEIMKSATEASIRVSGADIYKRAKDYFVPDTYTTELGQKATYWIDFFLSMCGITASFTDGDGNYVQENQSFGLDTVSSIIEPLLQQSGWYASVDPDGNLSIGKLSTDLSGEVISNGVDILSIQVEKSYDNTRNKVRVFGGLDIEGIDLTPISVEATREIPFLPTDQLIVAANPMISTLADAYDFANNLLIETAKPSNIKTVEIIGNPAIQAGIYIEVLSNAYAGKALVTSLDSSFNKNGYIMTLTLDSLCPRVVAHITLQPQIYAGTDGGGVWEYNIYDDEWTDISSGLTNLHIVDLSVDYGLFITSASGGGVYTKIGSQDWIHQTLPSPTTSGFTFGSGSYVYPGVYADSVNATVNAIVTYAGASGENSWSWLYTGTLVSGAAIFDWSYAPMDITSSGTGENVYARDIEGNYNDLFIVIDKGGSGGYIAAAEFLTYIDNGNNYLYKSNIDGQNATVLTSNADHCNKVSPDGKKVAYINTDGYLRVYNLVTNSFDFQTDIGDENDYLSWSPDSSQIAVDVWVDGWSYSDIYLVNVSTGSYSSITTNGEYLSPEWSHDGTSIAVLDWNDKGLYTMDTDGSNLTLVDTLSYIDIYRVAWSSDDSLLFYNDRGAAPDYKVMIYSITSAGSSKTKLTPDTGDNYYMGLYGNVVNDNDQVLSRTDADGNSYDIYIMDSDGSNLTRLSTEGGDSNHPTFDCIIANAVLYSNNSSGYYQIMRVDSSGAAETALTSYSYNISQSFAWIDAYLYYLYNGEVYKISEDGGTATKITTNYGDGDCIFTTLFSNAERTKLFANGQQISGTAFREVYDITLDGGYAKISDFINETPSAMYGIGTCATGSKVYAYADTSILFTTPDIYIVEGGGETFSISDAQPEAVSINDVLSYQNHTTHIVYVDGNALGTDEGGVAFSPDGTTYAYNYNGTDIKIEGGDVVYSGATNIYHFEWTYDSGYILYNDNGTLFSVKPEASSTPTSVLTFSANPDKYFMADNDSYRIASSHNNGLGKRNLFISTLRTPVTDNTDSDTEPYCGARDAQAVAGSASYLIETTDYETFTVLYSGTGFSETNVDTYSPVAIYGTFGTKYSEDFSTFNGSVASGVMTYDLAMRNYLTDTEIFVTTSSGIYYFNLGDNPTMVNSIVGTEIERRMYGDREVFVSIGGAVKKSTDYFDTYVDASTNLPGDTVTVLRLGEH